MNTVESSMNILFITLIHFIKNPLFLLINQFTCFLIDLWYIWKYCLLLLNFFRYFFLLLFLFLFLKHNLISEEGIKIPFRFLRIGLRLEGASIEFFHLLNFYHLFDLAFLWLQTLFSSFIKISCTQSQSAGKFL